MISVRLECTDMECHASEYVDVYENDLSAGAPLKGYVPEDWTIVKSDADGLAIALCSEHSAATRPEVPKCSLCQRKRTLQDAYDYNPLQAITGKPLGWYSGDDGEVCPECMTKTIRVI